MDYISGRNRYMGYLISLGIYSFKGVKVGLDCANGSSWNIAKSVFDALGADTYLMGLTTYAQLKQHEHIKERYEHNITYHGGRNRQPIWNRN